MFKAIKTFGIGLLYIILFPLIVVASFAYAAFGIVYGVFYTFALIGRFFHGKPLFPAYEEDILAQKKINEVYGKKQAEKEANNNPSNVYVQQNYYQNPQGQGQFPPNVYPQFTQMSQNPNPQFFNSPSQFPAPEESPKICSYDDEGNPLDEDGLPILVRREGNK